MNFELVVIYSSLSVSLHFIGCLWASPQMHLAHWSWLFSPIYAQKIFCLQPWGFAFRLEYFVSCPCILQEQIQANPPFFSGVWVPANRSSFIYSPTKMLLRAPLLPTTEDCTKHLRRTLQTLSNASCSLFFHALCDHSLSPSSCVHTKLLPNSQIHPALCSCHFIWNTNALLPKNLVIL